VRGVLPGTRWRVTVVTFRPKDRPPRLLLRVRDRLTGRLAHETLRDLTVHQRAKGYDLARKREEFLNSGAPEAREPVEWVKAKAAVLECLAARRRPATVACYRHILGWLERYIADAFPARSGGFTFVDQIDAGIAEGYVAWRRGHVRRVERAGDATINRDLRHLRSVWAYLVRLGLAAGNPWAAVPMLREFQQDRTRLTADQVARLVKAAGRKDLSFRAALCLATETGPRLGELAHVRWFHLDLRAGAWTITREPCGWQPKGNRERLVRFSEATARVLRQYQAARVAALVGGGLSAEDARAVVEAGRVFGRGRTAGHDCWERDFNMGLRAACQEIGAPEITCHGLRFTLGRLAKDAGAPALAIQDLLGHADFATTQRYIGEGQAAGAATAFAAMQGRIQETGKKQVKRPPTNGGRRRGKNGYNSRTTKVLR